jgi:predicted ATPase
VFVPLQAVSSAAFLAPAILSALDVPVQGQRDPREQLLDCLREKELLLVLDNLEQLLVPDERLDHDAVTLLADILAHAPDVTLLVTSRERLALQGEWLFGLSGLSYPAGETVNGVEGYGAVRLFMQRAGQVRRQFALADGEARAAAHICRLVEGLPLAIELAAAALRIRSCTAIAAAIESDLSALSTVLRAVPERHRSIRATFEHSWCLLSNEEQQVFPRLSVFRGGFEEEAAAEIAQASPQPLASLVDKSLLRWDGAARYDLHELVRQYANEKLEQAGETKQTRDAHLSHYLALAEAAEPKLVGTEQIKWMDRLDIEHDNVRAGLGWALEQGDGASALRLSGSMAEFWEVRGYWNEGRQWLEQALALSREVGSSRNSASAVRGWSAQALWQYGTLAWRQCDFAAARELLAQSLALYQEIDNRDGLANVLATMGAMAFEQGENATAQALYEECLALRRPFGNAERIGSALFGLGIVAFNVRDHTTARTLFEESLTFLRAAGSTLGISYILHCLGDLARIHGDFGAAHRLFEECLALRRELGYTRGIAATLHGLANMHVQQGDYVAARALYEESLRLNRELGNKRGMARVLSGMARLAQAQERILTAIQIFGGVEALLAQINARLPELEQSDQERALAVLRSQLDAIQFDAAWEQGGTLTLEEMIALADEIA